MFFTTLSNTKSNGLSPCLCANKKANDKDWLENASNSSYKLASSYFGSENLKKNFIDVIHLVKDNKYSNIESIAPGKFI